MRRNSTWKTLKEEKSTDTLYFMGSRNLSYIGGGYYALLPPEKLAFTRDDIR
jgi:hypothetical protein